MESFPPITWTESGQTPVLTESSSSRQRVAPHGRVTRSAVGPEIGPLMAAHQTSCGLCADW
jgi:hypothetical protein